MHLFDAGSKKHITKDPSLVARNHHITTTMVLSVFEQYYDYLQDNDYVNHMWNKND